MIPEIHISDYNYPLSDDRIAKYPLPERDSSKLLCYKSGLITEHIFREIPDILPENSILVYNDTKVVPARMNFVRDTGAHIEIFCLRPHNPTDYNIIFATKSSCEWSCVIGNSKRWKDDVLRLYNPDNDPKINELNLRATLIEKNGETGLVHFEWDNGEVFSNVLDICGKVPIPPYLNRETESIDVERYQTLYARFKGSVAAPTAGLHFTDRVLSKIDSKGIERETVCLHVGAGTFLPVKTDDVAEHPMHREPFVVKRDFINKIIKDIDSKKVVAVGTTSVRTLESLYYVGVSCIETGSPVDVEQWAPYTRDYKYSTKESLQAIADYLEASGLDELKIGTRIIIVPGFKFRIVNVLITNFHQPESTLILLVSAFLNGNWRQVYNYALEHGFRFLSYGDSSILFREG